MFDSCLRIHSVTQDAVSNIIGYSRLSSRTFGSQHILWKTCTLILRFKRRPRSYGLWPTL